MEPLKELNSGAKMPMEMEDTIRAKRLRINPSGVGNDIMPTILDCTPMAQFAIDTDHRITLWNRAFAEMTGIPAEKMIGTSDQWRPFYPHKRPVLADLIVDNNIPEAKTLSKDRGIRKSEIVPSAWEATDLFRNVGGKDRWFYFLAAPILDENGTMTGAIETVQDITARVQAENELRESQERYRILTEQVADGVALSQGGRLQFVNQAFARIFGYKRPQELIGRKTVDLIAEADRPLYRQVRKDLKAGRFDVKIADVRCIRSTGEPFWIAARNTVITWNGEPALLATVRDISDRKYRELARQEEAHHLGYENERLRSQLIRVYWNILGNGGMSFAMDCGQMAKRYWAYGTTRQDEHGYFADRRHTRG
jgi:PAS domain S-box-containing protein